MPQYLGAVTLVVRDYDEARDWYVGKLGFEVVEDSDLGGGKRWLLVAPPGTGSTRLLLAKAASPAQTAAIGNQTGGRVFLFLNTDDFWRDHRLYLARGVQFHEEPRVEAYGTVAVFEDLYGNLWDLLQLTRPNPPA
ncbi:VOC family protein [Labrys sp. LIt4]|uniref:VOC family protein n=1 Tax=Labrys sp. LIt4 TaxID=2821355 RepID=UPI001AE0A01D|nr:VOC family protein [Labrys sp. LIt4]MBP0580826.1 VOC family protein [Labrys sp. LIt4]